MASSHSGSTRAAAIRTFLIADIRGYTRFTSRQGDEAASRLATKFAEVATEGVEAWDGRLVELRGDEALAVFDSARQALRAAVELQSAFADETAAEPALPLEVGIGLDAGEAVPVGDGYRGAALNVAARLCAVAGSGEVLASEGLVHLAGRLEGLDYATLEATTLKGLDEPVAAVRVSGPVGTPPEITSRPDRPPPGPSPPLPAELESIVPLAGRELELRWLSWHWRRARHGHGRVLILSGPPGIGKTRLSAELASKGHELGATVVYSPALRAMDPTTIDDLIKRDAPGLVIIDDLDAAPAAMAPEVERIAHSIVGRPTLLLVTHRREASPPFLALVDRLAPPEQHRTLGALEPDAIRAIAALYAGRAIDDLALDDLVARSGGVPATVHQMASQWARATASQRLEASAGRTSADRRRLRAAEAELIDDVTDLESARERSRIYTLEGADEGDRANARTICPYKGLASFEAADAEYYFGRERLIAELIARFVGSSFLCLVGDSGSGKSSALLAGLMPALAGGVLPGSDAWPRAVMRPGEHPLVELGRALARAVVDRELPPPDDPAAALDAVMATLAAGGRLVIVVDQFEEVFNASRDDAERSAFIDLLTSDRPGLKVVVAIRADHYGRCAAYPALARAVGADHVLVGPLNAVELAAVVEHPAQRVGLRVEPELTEALVADAGTEPGMLPLLSTALLELWQARVNGRLTLASYVASGGLHGAVARLAESAYAELDPYRQTIARSMLLRLAGPGEGAELVRRRVPVSEFDADRDPAVAEVLTTLTRERLLTTGDGFVEVAHEALLREWPRLQGWLEEDAAGRALRLHLIGAVRDWEHRGREPGDLYRGARLAAALEWAADHQVELNAAEHDFLDASRQASQREVERQRRTNRILRGLLVGTAVLLLVAIGGFGFAALQARRAEDEAQSAEQQRVIAEQQRNDADRAKNIARAGELTASAIAVLDEDPRLSKLLAVEAASVSSDRPRRLTTTLHQAFAADPIVGHYAWPSDRAVGQLWTNLDPSGKRLVASGVFLAGSDHLEVADPVTGVVQWLYPMVDQGVKVGPSFFSPDGTQVIAGLYWDQLEGVQPPPNAPLGAFIFDAQTGRVLKQIDLGPCGGAISGVSETRILVRTLPMDGQGRDCDGAAAAAVVAVELTTGESKVLAAEADTAHERQGYPGLSQGALSGDGRFAAFGVVEGDGTHTVIVDVDTGKQVSEADPAATEDNALVSALNHDGSLLLVGSRPVRVFDVTGRTAKPLADLGGTTGDTSGTAFGPSEDTVFGTEHDGSLRLWKVHDGKEITVWPAVGSGRPSVSADGRFVLITDPARGATLLDTARRDEAGAVATCPGFVPSTSLQVAGGFAAFLSACNEDFAQEGTNVVELRTKAVLYTLPHTGGQTLSISPDARFLLVQDYTHQNAGPDRTARDIFGPIRLRDLRTGTPAVELEGVCSSDVPGDCKDFPVPPFPFEETISAWSPDGRMVGVSGRGEWAVWDGRSGHLIHAEPFDGFTSDLIFTPDSRGLILSGAWCDPGCEHHRNYLQLLSTETWEILRDETLDDAGAWLAGFTPDGSTLIAPGGATAEDSVIRWWDAQTLKVESGSFDNAFDSRVKSHAMSPNGSLLATGTAGGLLRVWNVENRTLAQEIKVGDVEIQGVAFIDDDHVAVTPVTGGLLIMTLDPNELLSIVQRSLTRGFTSGECQTYEIDDCPSLEQLRSLDFSGSPAGTTSPEISAPPSPSPTASPSPPTIASRSPDPVSWIADLTAGDDQPALYLNVALDGKGNVYAADQANHRIVIWDAAGAPTVWGKQGHAPGEFDFSGGDPDQSSSVAVAPDGRIAVGDAGNHRVQVFDGLRKFIFEFGHEGTNNGEFINACCVAFDSEGRLYVADPGRGDIQVFDEDGTFLRVIGSEGTGDGQFHHPGVPFVDPKTGDLWVPDYGNRRMEVVGSDGHFIATYGDGRYGGPLLTTVAGAVLDSAGRRFVVARNYVYVLDTQGKTVARLGPDVAGHGYVSPSYLALSNDGKLYLPDVTGSRVVILQLQPPLWPPPSP